MKRMLIICAVLLWIAGVTGSSFAATMSISSALELSESEMTAGESPNISSMWNSIYPNIFYNISKKLNSIKHHQHRYKEFNSITHHRNRHKKLNSITHHRHWHKERRVSQPGRVSEPLTLVLLGSGLMGIFAVKRRIRK